MTARLAVVLTVVVLVLPLAPGVVASPQSDDGGTVETSAVKKGNARWTFLKVVVNSDSGNGLQSANLLGPFGDGACVCQKRSFGICQSWAAFGSYRVRWLDATWEGRSSRLHFSGTSYREFPFSATNGIETMCNFSFDNQRALALSKAEFVQMSFFNSLPAGEASGWTRVTAVAPLLESGIGVPTTITTFGQGKWSGADASWSFTYQGDARFGGTTACLSCVVAAGSSQV